MLPSILGIGADVSVAVTDCIIQISRPTIFHNLTKAGYDYGGVVLNFFMRMSTYVETSEEFDRCCSDLYLFLKDSRTVATLSGECISAIKEMGESVANKKSYLSNHIRLFITNCMDSLTTSPVESQNS